MKIKVDGQMIENVTDYSMGNREDEKKIVFLYPARNLKSLRRNWCIKLFLMK